MRIKTGIESWGSRMGTVMEIKPTILFPPSRMEILVRIDNERLARSLELHEQYDEDMQKETVPCDLFFFQEELELQETQRRDNG